MKRKENPLPEELTVAQQKAINLLLEGRSNKAVAAALKISITTLWRWRRLPAFVDAFREHRQAMIAAVDISLINMVDMLADAVEAALTDTEPKNAYLRLQAAKLVLDHISNAERYDITDRLTELERRAEQDRMMKYVYDDQDEDDNGVPFVPTSFSGG